MKRFPGILLVASIVLCCGIRANELRHDLDIPGWGDPPSAGAAYSHHCDDGVDEIALPPPGSKVFGVHPAGTRYGYDHGKLRRVRFLFPKGGVDQLRPEIVDSLGNPEEGDPDSWATSDDVTLVSLYALPHPDDPNLLELADMDWSLHHVEGNPFLCRPIVQ
jgi:hypothetical protein